MGKPQSVYCTGPLEVVQQLSQVAHGFGVGVLDWDRYKADKSRQYKAVPVGKGYRGSSTQGEPDYYYFSAMGSAEGIAQFVLHARELGYPRSVVFAQDGYANGVDDASLRKLLSRAQKEVNVSKPFLVYWDPEGESLTAEANQLSSAACLKAKTPQRRMLLALRDMSGDVDNETINPTTWENGGLTAEVGRYALGQRGSTVPFLAILCPDQKTAEQLVQKLGQFEDVEEEQLLYARVRRVIGGAAPTTPAGEPDLPEAMTPDDFNSLLA